MPKDSELTYILESAAQVANVIKGNTDMSTLIFCIDISGSMCVSQPIEGQLNLKKKKQNYLMDLIDPGDEDQYMPDENRNLTYVSRLECVQAAIEAQLQEIAFISPDRKVGIVAFNNEIRIIGDGTYEEYVPEYRLDNFEDLQQFCIERKNYFVSHPIREKIQKLHEEILALEGYGMTA